MRKSLSFVAALALTSPVFAQQYFTVDPAEGVVSELKQFTLSPAAGYSCFDIEVESGIEVYKDGALFSAVSVNSSSMATNPVYTLATPATEAGQYEVRIADDAIWVYTSDFADGAYIPATTLTYTIEGSSVPTPDRLVTINPAEGVVTELNELSLSLPEGSKWGLIEILSSSAPSVARDGATFCGLDFGHITEGNPLNFRLKTPTTDPGVYNIIFPAGCLTLWNDDSYSEENEIEEEYIFTFTIEGTAQTNKVELVLDPAPGVVKSLEQFKLTSAVEGYAQFDINSDSENYVMKDGEEFCRFSYPDGSMDGNEYTLVLNTPATEPGEYQVVFPAGNISLWSEDYKNLDNTEDLVYTYVIEAPKVPTVYDAVVTKCKPAEGTVDMEAIQFESFTLTTNMNPVKVRQDAKIYFESPELGFSEELSMKANFGSQMVSFVNNSQAPKFNGVYTLVIPAGTFGDEAWLADNETGHSNEEIRLTFTFTGLVDLAVEYVAPVAVTPADGSRVSDLSEITVEFDRELQIADAPAFFLTKEGDWDYQGTLTPDVQSGTTFKFTIDPAPTELGTYMLEIPAGCFCDAVHVANEAEGVVSDVISLVYVFNPSTGVAELKGADAEGEIFTIDGVRAGKSLDELPAGLYIVGGKKVIVRK